MKRPAALTVAALAGVLLFQLSRPSGPPAGASASIEGMSAAGTDRVPPAIPSRPGPTVVAQGPNGPLVETSTPPSASATPAAGNGEVKGELRVRFDPGFPAQVREALSGVLDQPLRFPLRQGWNCELTAVRHEAASETEGVIQAEVAGHPGSHATLAYVGDAVAGTVFIPSEGLFRVRYQGGEIHRVEEVDPERMPGESEPLLPPAVAGPVAGAREPAGMGGDLLPAAGSAPVIRRDSAAEAAPIRDAATVVDLMVLYTPECASKNGGAAGVTALINAALATANSAYANSGSGVSLRLVHSGQVSYTGSGNLSTDLGRLRANGDGIMDQIHALRNTYRADLVSLFVPNGDYAGIGYLWTPAGASGFLSYGFTVVFDDYADANLTLAHEIGHNMGCGHAADDNAGGGAYSYSYGYHFNAGGTAYRTVMAYAPGIRIGRLSNPSLAYLGTSTGTADANNVATILNSKASLAGIYPAIVDGINWVVAVSCDLDASGKRDLIYRNSATGRVVAWMMDGVGQLRTEVLWPATNPGDSDWLTVTAGDFNSDGKADLIWRHRTTGRVIVWYMNGTTRVSTATLWPVTNPGDSDWVPLLAGDYNADGKQDLVWRNAVTGRVIVWYMNGATRTGTATIWPASNAGDSDWVPRTDGDFNRDGRPDIVWRHSSTGRVIVWYLNGVTRTGTATLWSPSAVGDSDWVPVVAGDYSGDSQSDLVWRNTTTGRTIVWFMSGATRASTTTVWAP